MKEVLINGRWPLKLPDHRADRPQWPWWEATRLAAMNHFIKPGMRVYDIGSEEGDFPALIAKWIGPKGTIHLFEPNPKVWPNIRAIFEANNLDNQVYFVGFAGDKTTIKPQQPDWEKAGDPWPECAYGEVIGDHGFMNLSERPDIPTIKIDDGAIPPVHVITIDTEGSELRVLTGAAKTLQESQPIVFVSIHPEFMKDMYGDTKEDLLAFMASLGYNDTFLSADHEEHWLFHPERSFH